MARVAQFNVTIQPIPQETLLVAFATRDGTAVANVDYMPNVGTMVFMPGEQTKMIPVTIDDAAKTGKRFFMDVAWIDPVSKLVVRPTGTCIIDVVQPE
jgi:endoglucanase